MAINFATSVYAVTYNVFARPVTITPTISQPLQPAYSTRGIYNTMPIDTVIEGGNIISDQRTILDIIETEVSVIPRQGDTVFIGASADLPELGTYVITDVDSNGGGETTLTLRKVMTAKP